MTRSRSRSEVIHNFVFNPEDNGGESIILSTIKYSDERYPEDIHYRQELSLQSYGNCATFNFSAYMTPEALRKLADELDAKMNK